MQTNKDPGDIRFFILISPAFNSSILTEMLLKEQAKAQVDQLKVKLDASWRWGYSYQMIERSLKLEKFIRTLKHESFECQVSSEDVALLRSVSEVIGDVVSALTLLEYRPCYMPSHSYAGPHPPSLQKINEDEGGNGGQKKASLKLTFG